MCSVGVPWINHCLNYGRMARTKNIVCCGATGVFPMRSTRILAPNPNPGQFMARHFYLHLLPKSPPFSTPPLVSRSLARWQAMGVKGLPKELPGGGVEDQCVRFLTLGVLQGPTRRPDDIDTGTLVFSCALRHKEAYNTGYHVPITREFQHQLISLYLIHKWDYTLVLDGCPWAEKCPEHQRRCRKEDLVIIDTTFITICVLICRQRFVKYITSPTEAEGK